MLAQIMPGTEEYLMQHTTSAYLGTDPTADSLHIGHLCGIMMLRHLQRCGHKPYLLVGGATGMIGDPSGKSQERNLLDSDTLYHNQEAIKKQVSKFLDFDGSEPNKAELVNNYDWMKDFTFLDFARTVGKHITVNYMMAKDSVQQRLNGTARDGLSFTEFTYQLLQGLRLPVPVSEVRCAPAVGRQRPVGQHDHRHRAHPPHAGQRGRGLLHHLSAHHQGRWQEVRKDRERQRMARPQPHHALGLLPVLAQRDRR